MKPFLVFMCPKCRNFTNAPVGQKRRRCSYCGTIIDISKSASALFDTPETASAAVKEFNASRGGDEFERAVERSKERILALLPEKRVSAKDISSGDETSRPPGMRKRLMRLLYNEARTRSCSLDRIEELCLNYGLDWKWVEGQLENLSNDGILVFPRPWSVQLVATDSLSKSKENAAKDVTNEILELLRLSQEMISISDIRNKLHEKGISEVSIETSLERLMQKGEIFEPKSGFVSLV